MFLGTKQLFLPFLLFLNSLTHNVFSMPPVKYQDCNKEARTLIFEGLNILIITFKYPCFSNTFLINLYLNMLFWFYFGFSNYIVLAGGQKIRVFLPHGFVLECLICSAMQYSHIFFLNKSE